MKVGKKKKKKRKEEKQISQKHNNLINMHLNSVCLCIYVRGLCVSFWKDVSVSEVAYSVHHANLGLPGRVHPILIIKLFVQSLSLKDSCILGLLL